MARCHVVSCLPIALLLTGCLDEPRTGLVRGGSVAPERVLTESQRRVMKAPATEANALRVLEVGRKLVTANPKLGIRPLFIAVGSDKPEIFHRGGGTEGYQVYVSDGLVNGCRDDAELAAVLSIELGKIVAEREALIANGVLVDKPPSINETIGNDVGGTFGSPDGTHAMELALYERDRRKVVPPAPPDELARKYLELAGYSPTVVEDVAPLLRKAEENYAVEKQFRKASE